MAGGGRARELREAVGEVGIVHVGQVVAGGGEFLGVGVTGVAQGIEAVTRMAGGRPAWESAFSGVMWGWRTSSVLLTRLRAMSKMSLDSR